MQTDEENTRWVEVWAVNSVEHYDQLVATAGDGPAALRELVETLWREAPDGSIEMYQAREMRHSDYDRVDWQEVVNTLLDTGDSDEEEEGDPDE